MSAKPVFLFSLPRAGSTLLQRMLATHAEIRSHSELWFLLPHVEAVRNRHTFSQYSNISLSNATRGLIEQLPNGIDDYYEAIRALADHVYDRLGGDEVRYVLDKTPRYYLIIDDIARIYPDAKFIFLFRNPLSVAASVVESFNAGRLGDYRHRIDLYGGPQALAEGYRHVRARSLVVHYEDLVTAPEKPLQRVCDYLGIPFEDQMAERFSDVPVGELGDQYGTKKYATLNSERIDNWKRVFATSYRKRYLQRYLRTVGRDPVETFGYDYDLLVKQIDDLSVRFTPGVIDRANRIKCAVMSVFEGMVFREKLLNGRRGHPRFFLLH